MEGRAGGLEGSMDARQVDWGAVDAKNILIDSKTPGGRVVSSSDPKSDCEVHSSLKTK